MPLAAGTQLGPYKILGPLGAGGMGEVYRAQDTRLGREVAVKVLPQPQAATADVRARFEREARTISQLGHPHICTLHDVGHQDGIDYLVMELLEGETLAHRLERGALPLPEIASLGRQICEALERAHRAGVVHRDLKPANIMLTKSGAKLMDFGLARPSGPSSTAQTSQSPTMSRPLTEEGALVGTFQYMAPEQLEGKESDARTDLWALGCVLYEMATGSRAFQAESQASLIAAIMTGAPRPVRELRPVTPPGLDRLIRRCLEKDPDERMQSALDVAFLLGVVMEERIGTAASPAGVRRVAPWLLVAGTAAIAAVGFLAGRMTSKPPGLAAIGASTLSQGNRDRAPAVSPDGRLVAFGSVRQNGQGLWLMDMVSRSELKLTSEADGDPRFTADGSNLVFTRVREGRSSLWRVPVLGGRPRLLVDSGSDADPSPDGTRLAYVAAVNDSLGAQARVMIASSDGTGGRALWSGGAALLATPRWSPDGKRIAVVQSGVQNAPGSIVVVDASNGSTRTYPSPNGAVLSSPVWDGTGDGILVVEGIGIVAVQRGASGRLFRLDTRSGRWRPLGWFETFPNWIELLPDGRLVLSTFRVRQNLREVPMGARTLDDGRWLTGGLAVDRQPVYSPDGKSVMFSSNRGGTLDLWEVSVETGEMHRVTDDPQDDWDPEYAPNGESIYWSSGRSGAFEIWTARRDGSAARQLSRDSLDAENPTVSPDEAWVVYSSAHPRKSGLWRVPVREGAEEWVLKTTPLIPDLSPDGRFVSLLSDVGPTGSKLSVFDLQERRLLPKSVPTVTVPGTVQIGRSRFAPDGNSVIYVGATQNGQPILLRRPLTAWRTGEGRVDTLFARTTDTIESFDFTADGTRAVVSVVDWLSALTISDAVPSITPPRRRR